MKEGVVSTNTNSNALTPAGGNIVILADWTTPILDVMNNRGLKWNYYPAPIWKTQATTFMNSDFLAINAATRVPDAAWEVLKWVAFRIGSKEPRGRAHATRGAPRAPAPPYRSPRGSAVSVSPVRGLERSHASACRAISAEAAAAVPPPTTGSVSMYSTAHPPR